MGCWLCSVCQSLLEELGVDWEYWVYGQMFAARGEPLTLLFNLRANRCAFPCLSFPLGTRRQEQDPLSLPNTCTKSHGRAAQVHQTCILPSSRCVLGLNVAFSTCIGFPLPTALPGQPRWCLSWLYLCWGLERMRLGRLGREPALEAVSSPSSCLRSRAPLRHCPTKSSAAVIHR